MPTTSNGDCCVELMLGALVRPIARYPSAIAYDDPLKVASNRTRTTLTRHAGTGDTVLSVSDASRIVPQMLLTVDNEIVSVSAIDGNLLTVIRGFDGTMPACHSAGSVLNANIVAWHHNVLAAEITAIETALGPNLINISDVASAIINTKYIFGAQSPGGSLIAGANTITLTPVPIGVNGTDPNHWLYVSGGTGAAEAVKIIGGSAVSGAASGTLIIQCANAHSGSWTIQSATAGIAEMVQANGAGASMLIAPGTQTVYGPVDISGIHGITLRGFGQGSSTIDLAHPSNDFITYGLETDNVTIGDFNVKSSVTRTGGWVIRGTAAYNQPGLLRWSRIANISVRHQANGFWLAKYAGVLVDACVMEDFATSPTGVGIKAGQTCATDVNQGSELHIRNTQIYGDSAIGLTPALGYGFWIEDCDAVYLEPGTGCGIVTQGVARYVCGAHGIINHSIEGFVSDGGPCAQGAGILFTGPGTLMDTMISNSWIASSGGTTTLNAAGIRVECAVVSRLDIRNNRFLNNRGPGLYISGPTNTGGGPMNIQGNTFTGNGTGNQAGYIDDIYLNFPFDQNAAFVAGNVHTGSPYGVSLRTSGSTNFLRLGTNYWQNGFDFGVPPKSGLLLPVVPTSALIGGSPMTAGQRTDPIFTTVTGARLGMSVTINPGADAGGAFIPLAWVSANDTVAACICSISAATPIAIHYYLKVEN